MEKNDGFDIVQSEWTEAEEPFQSSTLSSLVKRQSVPSREANQLWVIQAKAGDRNALENLVSRNMRLVYKIARSYLWSGIPIEDLAQEGVIGFMTAIEKFKSDQGASISTYATWWIRQAIQRYAINNCRLLRLPVRVQQLISHILEAQDELLESGKNPTDEAVAVKLGLKVRQVKLALSAFHQREGVFSLDEAVSNRHNEEGCTFAELIGDQRFSSPEVVLSAKMEIEQFVKGVHLLVSRIHSTKMSRACLVFLEYYGLNKARESSNVMAISKTLGISHQRVSGIKSEIWKENPNFFEGLNFTTETEFKQLLQGLPELEELAHMYVAWDEVFFGY